MGKTEIYLIKFELYERNDSKMKIGIDLGGSHIAIGVVDNKGRIAEKIEKRIMNKEKKNIEKTIEEYIEYNLKILKEKYEITQIGLLFQEQ